jgi:hypothetical protein
MSCFKHGHAGIRSSTYYAWTGMRRRCNNPDNKYYGGRGIKVCERWGKFENFLEDMGERPDGLELDREDNEGNYTPDNCRWVTKKVNGRNKRNNHLVTANGKTQCVTAWAEETGISYDVIYMRINQMGWPEDMAVTTPLTRRKWDVTAYGKTKPIAQWSKEMGISYIAIKRRLQRGWSGEEAVSAPSKESL